MGKVLIFNILLLFLYKCSYSQNNDKEAIRNSFFDLGISFINQEGFEVSRHLFFEKLSTDNINSDTLIIVELFTDTHNYYRAGYFASNISELRCFNVQMDVQENSLFRKIYENERCNFYLFILDYIRKNRLHDILQRGEKVTRTPNTIVILTISKKEDEKFNYSVFQTNIFSVY